MNPLAPYIPLVEFLGKAMGPHCEVVLHDVSSPENSIIAIANGHVSGRSVGGPLTDLVLKVMKDGLRGNQPFISNYNARLKNNATCRSGSYFIKDANDKIIGVLCVNLDISKLMETRKFIDEMIGAQEPVAPAASPIAETIDVFENLPESIDDVLNAIIDKVLKEIPVSPERMSVEEKIDVVKRSNEHGLFLLKGGLSELAKRMQLSEATIYRYLNKVKG
jgi:predicted transcriptional regulator YheO